MSDHDNAPAWTRAVLRDTLGDDWRSAPDEDKRRALGDALVREDAALDQKVAQAEEELAYHRAVSEEVERRLALPNPPPESDLIAGAWLRVAHRMYGGHTPLTRRVRDLFYAFVEEVCLLVEADDIGDTFPDGWWK